MASDPSQLMAMLAQNSGLAGQYFLNGQDQARQQQAQDQATAANALKLQDLQRQAADDASFQADWADYQKDPSNDKLAQIAVKHPTKTEAVKEFWAIKSPEVRQSHITAIAQPLAALQNNRPDLALQSLQQLRDAAAKAGEPTNDLDGEISALQSGDTDAMNAVKANLMMHVAAADADGKFAESLSKAQKAFAGGDPYTLAPGDIRYDGNNNVVAQGGPKLTEPHYEKIDVLDKYGVKKGERVIQIGGGPSGGSASPGAPAAAANLGTPAAARYTGGWTPRLRNGGDNTDAAVDSKIAGAAQFLGISPTDPVTNISPLRIAKAMTLSEGGPGSLADRNNNPANLRNADGTYKVFPSKQAGIAAAASLVARKLKNGQTTVQSLIEGLPVGGLAGAPIPSPALAKGNGAVVYDSTAGQLGDSFDPTTQIRAGVDSTVPQDIRSTVKAIATGQMAQPSSFALTKPYWQNVMAAVSAYDPTFDSSTQPQRVAAAKAFTGNGKAAQVLASIDRLSYHVNDLYRDSQALTGWDLGPASAIFNSGVQSFQKAAVARYKAALPFIAGELQKLTKNGSATEGESRDIMANLAPSQPASARLAAMQQLAELTQGQFKPIRDQWASAFQDGRPMPMDASPEANAILDNLSGDKGPVAIDPHTGKLAAGAKPPSAAAPAAIPPSAVAYLKSHPALSQAFDQKYGLGAAARVLGR